MASIDSLNDFLRAAAYHFEKNRPFIFMELHLLASALFPIYAGAHASLSRPSSAAKPEKRSADNEDDDEEEDKTHDMEGLSAKDAVIFPITAGVILMGLYFAIKAYGADMINLVLGVYFSLIGTFSVAKLINDSWGFVQSFITPGYYRDDGKLWKVLGSERKAVSVEGEKEVTPRSSPLPGPLARIPLPTPIASLLWAMRDFTKRKYAVKGFLRDAFDFQTILTQHNVLSALFGITAIGYSFVDKPWWLTNLQGFAVSYGALQLMSPTTFATGTLILSGLFFYDIWAVFFTPFMVGVAKNLDVPIKLIFPRPDLPSRTPGEPPIKSYSMLGLGDIVLPGIMIGLALRFDLYMIYLRKQKKTTGSVVGEHEITKAPYVSVIGNWGDRFWTFGTASSASAASLPAHLKSSFPKPYFHATMIGYVFGMLLTLGFMTVFQHAQPALLYLVPCVLASLWGTGFIRGELKYMWEFTEAVTGEQIDEDQEEKKDDAKDEATSDSVLSTVWNVVFGKNEDKTSQAAEKSQQAEPKKDTKKDETKAHSKEKKATDGKTEESTVFRFEISDHPPKTEGTKKTQGWKGTADAGKNHASTDSVSDDTVVVSSADLDDAKGTTKS